MQLLTVCSAAAVYIAGEQEVLTEDLNELSSPGEETDDEFQPGPSKKVKVSLIS